jgi:hypothetical protein
MSDQVVFGADAKEYFDVIARMEQRLTELGSKVGRSRFDVGDSAGGLLRGEYRVERQTSLLTRNLLEARSASDALTAALQAGVFSTKLPLAAGLGGVVIAEGLKIILDQAEKTKKAYNELREELDKPIGVQVHLSGAEIGSSLEKLEQKVKSLRKELNSNTTSFVNFLKGNDDTESARLHRAEHGQPESTQKAPEEQALSLAETRIKQLANAQADAELKIVAVKRHSVEVSKDEGEALKANLDYENARAKLFENAFKPGAEQAVLFKRLAALTQERDLTLEIVKLRQKATLESQLQKDQEAETQFNKDVGSGKFVNQTIPQQDLEEQQRTAGEALIAELRADRDNGVSLGPNAKRILKEADRLSGNTRKDYSGLAALDGLKFEGLRALDGLTITIK